MLWSRDLEGLREGGGSHMTIWNLSSRESKCKSPELVGMCKEGRGWVAESLALLLAS